MEQKIETRLLNLSKSLGYMEKPSMADVAKSGADKIITLRTQQAELVKALEELYKAAWSEEKDGKENYIFNLRRLSNAADRAEKILAQYKGDT